MSLLSTAATSVNPWMQILEALEKKINRHSYDTWLKPTRYSHVKDGKLFVRVPTLEFRHIGEKYADLIQEAIEALHLGLDDVEFITPEQQQPPNAAAPRVRHDGGFAPQAANPGRGGQGRFDWDSAAQLNSRYTFDAFVIGAEASCPTG